MDRSDDCRSGYECVDNVCSSIPECIDICDRAEECEISFQEEDEPFSYAGCLAQCGSTVRGWGEEALESFKTCFTEDNSCEELQDTDNAPQMCYNELELPADREGMCDDFASLADSCGNDSDAVEELNGTCRQAGRTWGEDDWDDVAECVVVPRDCVEQIECINDVFDLESPLEHNDIGAVDNQGMNDNAQEMNDRSDN